MGCGDMETKRLCKINLCVHSHCGILCVLCYIEVCLAYNNCFPIYP